jgi:hypothetical protein
MDASSVPILVAGLFLLGPLVVVPLGLYLVPPLVTEHAAGLLRIARVGALPAGLLLALAFALEPGPTAGLLAAPWLAMAAIGAAAAALDLLGAWRRGRLLRPGPPHAIWAALGFLAVAAGNATADRLGVQPFGFAPVIILLTAVHFTFAGFVLVLVGTLAHVARPGRLSAVAVGAVVVGISVTAVGFFGVDVAALVGAVLVGTGGLGLGVVLLRGPGRGIAGSASARWLRRLAGAGLLVSMPLAIAYAVGAFLGVSWLDLPTMARTHGAINVLAVAVPATVAFAFDRIAATAPTTVRAPVR